MNVLSTSNTKNFTRASDVRIPEIYSRRFKTGKDDLDELFGGQGFLPGQMITVAAGAGTGKSSFLLQMMQSLEDAGKKTAYISAEESIEQVSFACKRLSVSSVPLANITDIEDIEQAVIEHKFEFLVIDSYPTITTSKKNLNTRQKEEYIIGRLVRLAKEHEVCIAIILHMTKNNKFKGTTLLNHAIDTFMTIEKNPDDMHLRDFMIHKNRFGGGSFTTFEFGSQGYIFNAISSDSNPVSKGSKKASKSDIVLDSLTTPKTAAQIVEETTVGGAYLTSILREFVTQGKAEKTGRGADATYVRI